jgi:hypothetical protein
VEVMLSPDGRLWIDRLAGGLADTGDRLSAADGERIVPLVAHHVGAEVHPTRRHFGRTAGNGRAFRGFDPTGRRGTRICDLQVLGRDLHPPRLWCWPPRQAAH